MKPLYDSIGATYTVTRRADPAIVETLVRRLALRENTEGAFLDLACGTGNYTHALAAVGGRWHGVDISRTMLDKAVARSTRGGGRGIEWRMGSALSLPFADGAFQGVSCTLAIHHFPEIRTPFREVHRVMSSGRFVLFTSFPDQMRNYWLCHYFPRMLDRSCAIMPTRAATETALLEAGFVDVEIVPFEVTDELQDLFLQSGKHRPEMYFDATYRANISSFAAMSDPTEVESGLARLRSDIDDGTFAEVARRYATPDGDYAFVVATRRAR